jgi:5'-nucleotidase/UDP-sugar diphosphatase
MRHLRSFLLVLIVLAFPVRGATTVTLLHFSDYHSHALPFFTDEGERGGLARAVGYLRQEKRRGALVFSGGDMINKGAPAWSDKYGCAEWPWLNGIVDAMAFGNHDADYGREQFETCRRQLDYPVLSANTAGFRPWAVFDVKGTRVGVFAVAGPDFPKLVKTPGLAFGDSVAAAREAVRALRDEQRADVVVMIGHESSEADFELARTVPGIDLIFGSHSHLRADLTQIPGTTTAFIAPFQYLTYIARVELTVAEGRVTGVRGTLVPVDERLPADRGIERRVKRMQAALEKDPQYRPLFANIGQLRTPVKTPDLASKTVDIMRAVMKADVALSTASSFRRPLAAGPVTLEELRAALPYDNEIVVCSMAGADLRLLLQEAERRTGDAGAYVSRGDITGDGPFRVAATDHMANLAWRELFPCEKQATGVRVRAEVEKWLSSQ